MDREPATRHPAGRLARVALPGIAFGLLVVLLIRYFDRGFTPGDAFTYLAAGERLNAGSLLYQLSPGDRPVELRPPYWTVPFLSPPFIAVVWRPLAALPAEAGVYLWWTGAVLCIGGVLVAMLRRALVTTSVAVLVLVIPITYEIGVGNVNGYLLAGSIGAWLLARRKRVGPAGLLAAVMVAVKLTPLPLASWVIGVERRRGVVAVVVGLTSCAIISLLGAGLPAHVEYLAVARETATTGLSQWSGGGIARAAGLPDPIPTLVPTVILLGGALASLGLAQRGRPAHGYAVAIVAWTFGSPVVNVNTLIFLLALVAPIAWPWNPELVPDSYPRRPRDTSALEASETA